MTRHMSGVILELEEDSIGVRVSRRVRAALKLWYHVLIPQNVNLSSSRGRYGLREFLQDIKLVVFLVTDREPLRYPSEADADADAHLDSVRRARHVLRRSRYCELWCWWLTVLFRLLLR